MSDIDELEAKAKAAKRADVSEHGAFDPCEFRAACSPDAILDLIRRVREAEARNVTLKSIHDEAWTALQAAGIHPSDIRTFGEFIAEIATERDEALANLATMTRVYERACDSQVEAQRERDEARVAKEQAERALARLSPNGRPGVQLYLGPDSDAPDMPMFGIVVTRSPFLVEDDTNHLGARDVYQWVYDEESYRCEVESIGYLIDDEWLCDESDKHEAALDAVRAERDAAIAAMEAMRVERDAIATALNGLVAASSEITHWDWYGLLMDHPDSDEVRSNVDALEDAAVSAVRALREHARKAGT